jgi:hypothetical protein
MYIFKNYEVRYSRMINKFGFSNMAIKFVNIKTSPNVNRIMGSRDHVSAQGPGSGDSVKMGSRYR